MPSLFNTIKLWLTGDEPTARRLTERHIATATIGLHTEHAGDRQDDADVAFVGGVVWPIEAGSHGARSALTSWCFLAEYRAQSKTVHMLDSVDGAEHPGAVPLVVGQNVEIEGSTERSGVGYVVRTSLMGEEGLYKNVFMLSGVGRGAGADLVAHHLPPDQPANSTQVHDPDGNGRHAGMHWAVRVRRWVSQLCNIGKTVSTEEPESYALMLNFGTNGDGSPAYGLAHFDRGEALLADDGGGPLATADDDNHVVAYVPHDDPSFPVFRGNQGGLNIVTALWGNVVSGIIYSPAEFVNQQWESGEKGLYPRRVEWREDFEDRHPTRCGKMAPGRKKWQTWTNKARPERGPKSGDPSGRKTPVQDPSGVKTPVDTAPKTPIVPPERGPKTGDPPNPVYVAIKVPDPTIDDWWVDAEAGPLEEEAPSDYGHPRPGEPEVPGPVHEGAAGESEGYNEQWLSTVGFTEEQWNRTPVIAHEDTLPVYTADAPREGGATPHDRWPTVKSQEEHLIIGEDGRMLSRPKVAAGPGSRLDGPVQMRAGYSLALNDQKTEALNINFDDFARIVVAFKTADGRVADSRFGLGRRVTTSPYVASGFEFSLDYDGNGGAADPDLLLTPKNASAAAGDATGVAAVRVLSDVAVSGEVAVSRVQLTPIAGTSVPTPGSGVTLFYNQTTGALSVKAPDGVISTVDLT